MSKLKISLCILMSLIVLAGCHEKDPKTVEISVQLNKLKNARMDIVTNNLMNFDTILISTSKLDSTGSGTIKFALEHPVYAVISIADRHIPLYISPGDELKVESDTSKIGNGIKFSGDGASIQKFLRLSYAAKDKYEVIDGKYSIQAEEKDFLVRRDSLQKAYSALLANLTKDKTVGKEAVDMMRFMHKSSLYFFQQNYVTGRYDDEKDFPESIRSALKDLPQDTMALSANMYEYGIILNMFLQRKIFEAADETIGNREDIEVSVAAENEIKKLPYPKPLKEYFQAANVNFWVRMEGLSPEIETLRENVMKELKTPVYVKTINKSFEMWAPLAAGKPAPDFAGYTPNGERLSLSDLKGKVVYVDVWATWCGPCKEEFPHAKKLMKEFDGNDKVVFLFLSTDSDHAAWEKLLGDKSIPRGLHLHQKQDKQPDAIWENYHLWGIPRYILIDADGKMMQAHAPRPSSGEVGDLLRKAI